MSGGTHGVVLGDLARAAHLAPTLLVTGLTAALAVAVGRGGQAVVVAAAVLAGQLSVGWSNDAADAEHDRRSGRQDKPAAVGTLSPRLLWSLASAALVLAVPLSWWAGGTDALLVHLVALAAAWGYNLGLHRTSWSWLPYTLAFALLPAFVWLGLPGSPWPPWWVTACAALLGTAAHLANALPDRARDVQDGVGGLVVHLPVPLTRGLLGGLVLAAAVVAAVGAPGALTPARWGALAVAAALAALAAREPRRTGDRGALLALAGVAAVAILLLVSSVQAGVTPSPTAADTGAHYAARP